MTTTQSFKYEIDQMVTRPDGRECRIAERTISNGVRSYYLRTAAIGGWYAEGEVR